MSTLTVIGIDPGRTTGIARLRYIDGQLVTTDIAQCNPSMVLPLVSSLLALWWQNDSRNGSGSPHLAIERYVASNRSARSTDPGASKITMDLVGKLQQLAEGFLVVGVHVHLRRATDVKPWATQARLNKTVGVVKGLPHGLDAVRHALFCATADCRIPDPLSRRSPAPKEAVE